MALTPHRHPQRKHRSRSRDRRGAGALRSLSLVRSLPGRAQGTV